MERKFIPLNRDERDMELWENAEVEARQKHDAESAREGLVLAQICADFVDEKGPLEGEKA